MTLSEDEKNARKKRIAPFLELLIVHKRAEIELMKLVIEVTEAEEFDYVAAYGKLWDMTKEYDAAWEAARARVNRMLWLIDTALAHTQYGEQYLHQRLMPKWKLRKEVAA